MPTNTRTFKQMGIAFGNQNLEITAKVDNVIVYQGTVVTSNVPEPELPNIDYSITNELFSWTIGNIEYSGSSVIEITVGNGAELLVGSLQANYNTVPGNTANTWISSGPDGYQSFHWQQFGNTYINNVLQDSQTINHNLPNQDGMWWWTLPAGTTFIENITITPGCPLPEV